MTYLFETDEHKTLRQQAGRFAEAHLAPFASDWEEREVFPAHLPKLAGDAHLIGIGYPEIYGGSGGDLTHALVAAEEMVLKGKIVGVNVSLGSHAIVLPLILKLGTEAQKRKFIPPVLRGEWRASLGVTEPGAGSDVAGLTTRARADGAGFRISGQKTFITSGPAADVVLVAARTGGAGHAGLSLFLVEKGSFSVSQELKKMGWRSSDTAELFFDDCFVPRDHVLGEVDAGFYALMSNFVSERLFIAGQCVAIAELALQESIRYAKERHAFGKPLTGFQVTRHKLADMSSLIAAARALTGEVAVRHVRGEEVSTLAAKAKNVASDMCSVVTDAAVQIHGGAGYLRGTVVERLFRDARLYPIGGGTREVMNEIISKADGF